ncbi:MAG: phage tail tape measure protein, partial [Candidatus Heimdallarchaeaceae archaeon]
LGVATDLSGEEAATALTRILNVTGEGIETIDKFGSVIVALGNNFAATESEIVKVATEVSRSTAVFDVSSSQAAALATALRSVGVQAQIGGSAVGRAFRAIDQSIRDGGTSLQNLSTITGITGDQLKKTFEEDSTAVFQAFIEGLGEIENQGGSTTEALAAFGLKGDEILKVLPVLAKNSELLGDALSTAANELENTNALNTEAAKAFDTLLSRFQVFQNAVSNAAVNIGAELAPQISELLSQLTDLATTIAEADKETLSLIATFLKWATIITGAIASATSAALAFLKLRQIVTPLVKVFGSVGTAVSGLVKRFTGLIGLVELGGSSFEAPFDAATASAEQLERRLTSLRSELNDINNLGPDFELTPEQEAFKENLEDQIDLFERLIGAKEAAAADSRVGTGELLIRPEADTSGFSVPDLVPQAQEQSIPLRRAEEIEDAPTDDALKTRLNKEQEIIDEATQKRIDTAKRQNEALLQLQRAGQENATTEELEFLERRLAIDEEFAQARLIKNQTERDLALQNLQLQHAKELEQIEEFENTKDERDAQRREVRDALKEELRALDLETRDAEIEEDLAREISALDTQKEAEQKFRTERIQAQIAERNQFKQDEIKFGTEVAQLKSFFRKEEVQGVKNASQQLAQLSRSRNSTLKGIGKAAARVNAAIATSEGAIKAYSSLAGIPIVGPALGAAAAAALIAFGVEQQAQISAAQTGGFVPPAGGGARDRVPTLLEPGELVVPQAIAPNFIQAAGIPDTQADSAQSSVPGDQGGEDTTPVIEIMLQDRAGEVISLEQREGRALGIIAEEE